jgi:hypothetical protein
MMVGHFDVKNLNEDVVVEDESGTTATGIHTGIGVVVPASKIIETIEHPDLVQRRKKRAVEIREQAGGIPPPHP